VAGGSICRWSAGGRGYRRFSRDGPHGGPGIVLDGRAVPFYPKRWKSEVLRLVVELPIIRDERKVV
jgi:hypothetical protein